MTVSPSQCDFPSDMNLLVDACIARVRETARLDEDAVLPPLPVIAPRRDVAVFTKSQVARATSDRPPADVARPRTDVTTERSSRRPSRSGRWAMFLCGFVAAAAASAAFLASPIGKRPGVQRVTHAAVAHASHAAQATRSLLHAAQ